MSLWFRRRYNLPPTDPRFLDATPALIAEDYWANHYQDRRDAGKPDEEEIEDDDFDLDAITAAAARAAETGGDVWEDVSFERPTD